MLSVEEDVLRAVVNLSKNKDFKEVRRWIERSYLAQSVRNNVQRDEVFLRQGQGRAAILDEIGKAFDDNQALLTLNKMKDLFQKD